jgi:hypothetical protein
MLRDSLPSRGAPAESLIRRGILFAQKFFAKIVDRRITYGVRVVLRQQGRFREGNTMEQQWENDDEVVTTFRTIKMTQQENYDAGFAAGVAWAEAQVKAGA